MNRVATNLLAVCLVCGCTMPKAPNAMVNEHVFLKVIENGSEAYAREVLGNPTRKGEGEVVKFCLPGDAETHFTIAEHCETHNPDYFACFCGGSESIRLLFSGFNRRLLAAEYCVHDNPIFYTGIRSEGCRSIMDIAGSIPRSGAPEIDSGCAQRKQVLKDFFKQSQAAGAFFKQKQAVASNTGSPPPEIPTRNPTPGPSPEIVVPVLRPFSPDETPDANSKPRGDHVKPANQPCGLRPGPDSTGRPAGEPPPTAKQPHAAPGQRADGGDKPRHEPQQQASLAGTWQTFQGARLRIDDDGKTLTLKLVGKSDNLRKVYGKLSRRNAKSFAGTLDVLFWADWKQRTIHVTAILDDENHLKLTYSDWPEWNGRTRRYQTRLLKEDWERLATH